MAIYQLLINNVDAMASQTVSLVSFERTYDDPAQLVIQAHGDWRQPPFSADSEVSLSVDGVVVFLGLLDLPNPVASESDYPMVSYTVFDHSRLMRFPSAVDAQGNPTITLSPGPLSSVVTQYLSHVGQLLSDKGLNPLVTYANGADIIETLPVSLENQSIDAGFRQIAAAAPGVRLLVVPDSSGSKSQYTFVNLFGATGFDLALDSDRVPELSIQQSIEGRAGAVRTLSGRTIGTADVEIDQTQPLVPNWTSSDESAWTFFDAFTLDTSGNPTAISKVYREFSFAAFSDQIDADTPMVALIKVIEDDVNPRWQKLRVQSIDLTNKTLLLVRPAVKNLKSLKAGRFNMLDPGRGKPATSVLRFKISGTASIPIFINVVRVPAAGFSGRAFQIAPRTMAYEKIITVPDGVSIQAFASDSHRALSEPIISGEIPINGDLPSDLWFLNRRINIVTLDHGLTGYEGLAAPVMGIQVSFNPAVSSAIRFNRDDTAFLAGASQ